MMVSVLNGGVLQLHHPDGQVFRFDPGSLAFAFSVTGHPFDSERFETLREPRDLERWAADILGAVGMHATAASVPEAKCLRAAIWNAAEAVIDGRAVRAADRSTLNRFAASPSLAPRLDPGGTRSWALASDASELFSTIARDAIEVATGQLASRIKRCEGINCGIPFVDTSRPGNRRWCSMERCGNRAKVAAHRRRHRQEASK
jgi:predicted RNA-binding Zn ribbon-like protein